MKLQKKASIEVYKHSVLSYIVTNNVALQFEKTSSRVLCTPENECLLFRIFHRKQLANIAELSGHV